MRVERSEDEEIAAFLEADKRILKRMRWKHKGHRDYVYISVAVLWDDFGKTKRGQLNITSHCIAVPRRFTICLNFRGKRVLGLDVNPGQAHKNILIKATIKRTHWHIYTSPDAEEDDRNLIFSAWIYEFLEKSKIYAKSPPSAPPMAREVQLLLPGCDHA